MELNDDGFLAEAVNNISPKLVDGGRKFRGPNATYDFIQQVWIEKALLQTRALPAILEKEGQNYRQQKRMIDDISTKGKYTNTTGWSPKREFKFDFSISPMTYNYFANIVGPFMDSGKEIWSDTNSKVWKKIKRLIITGDKVGIGKLQKHIQTCLLRESGKKIAGGISGLKTEGAGAPGNTKEDDIQQPVRDGDLREGPHPLPESEDNTEPKRLGTDVPGGEGCLGEVEEAGGTANGEDTP